METTEVVIVGSGPTGLMLARELSLAGVRSVVLEKLPERSGLRKALNLQPRTAEMFDLRGLLDDAGVRSIANVPDGHFAGLPVPLGFEGWDSRRPYQVTIPQARVEALLEEGLADGFGAVVRYGTEVTGVTEVAGGVEVRTVGPDGREEVIQAQYAVACDGGRSTVRKLLEVPFPGVDPRAFGVVADLEIAPGAASVPTKWGSSVDLFSRPGPAGHMAMLLPMDEPGLYWSVIMGPTPPRDRDEPVTVEELEAGIHAFFGDDVRVSRVIAASRFTDASRQVESYRAGRVLFAGDAAHIHIPVGGQGMNLGLQDAMNLGWKLAAEIRGTAPAGLLDTYSAERHPVAAQVLANTRAQGMLMFAKEDPAVAAIREVLHGVLTVPEANRHIAGMISGLSIRYPIGTATAVDHPFRGTRLPDAEIDGTWASSHFVEGRGVLFHTGPDDADALAPWADRVRSVHVERMPDAWPDVAGLLVRPDGYVCALLPADGLQESLSGWFGEPASSPVGAAA